MSPRPSLPTETETGVLLRSGRRCCVCFSLRQDAGVKKGQIAHLDRVPRNNSPENLAFLCLEHHDEYDSQTRQSKGLTKREIKKYRDLLYQARQDSSRGDSALEDHIIRELSSQKFSVNHRQFTFTQVFAETSPELATGCSLAYFGVLLADLIGFGDEAVGWAGLRRALGFEASRIFGEFVLWGLWQQLPGSDRSQERYCLTDLGRSVSLRMRQGSTNVG